MSACQRLINRLRAQLTNLDSDPVRVRAVHRNTEYCTAPSDCATPVVNTTTCSFNIFEIYINKRTQKLAHTNPNVHIFVTIVQVVHRNCVQNIYSRTLAISANVITDLLFLAELKTSSSGLKNHVRVRKLNVHGDCLGTRDIETNILIENSPKRILTITNLYLVQYSI